MRQAAERSAGYASTGEKYPERLKAVAPLGTRARIKRVAEKEGLSTGEVIRRALAAYFDALAGSHGARA